MHISRPISFSVRPVRSSPPEGAFRRRGANCTDGAKDVFVDAGEISSIGQLRFRMMNGMYHIKSYRYVSVYTC